MVAAFATCFKALITSIAPVGRLIACRVQHLTDETNTQAPARDGSHIHGAPAPGDFASGRPRERHGSGRGSGSTRTGLGSRTSKRAPSTNAKGKRRRLAWSPSSEFHLHGSLPSPPTVDEDDSSTRTVTRDALRGRCSCPYQSGN